MARVFVFDISVFFQAVDDAPEVDARFNYWDESDYDSVQDENVESSNPNIAADTSIHYLISTSTRPILGS